MKSGKTVPVILGPTCVGKTAISVELSLLVNTEIISCDSRQVFVGMNIGTAKPPYHIQQIVRHHLIDVAYPDETFTAQLWAELAEQTIQTIQKKNKLPLIVCGTGLYLKALMEGFFQLPEMTEEKRESIEQKIKKLEQDTSLHGYLKKIDAESADRIHQNDTYRIKRALEIFLLTGKPPCYHRKKMNKKSTSHFQLIGLTMDRSKLYQAIDQRVEEMVNDGFIKEVKYLLKVGYNKNLTAFQAPGYSEFIQCFNGIISEKDAISKTKMKTRNYAKRQFTWFRKLKEITWFDVSDSYRNCVKNITDLIIGTGS